jgi:hypothetical protein
MALIIPLEKWFDFFSKEGWSPIFKWVLIALYIHGTIILLIRQIKRKILLVLKWNHLSCDRKGKTLVIMCHAPITLFNCMVAFHFIFSIGYGLPLSYLHRKKLREYKETNTCTNNEQCQYDY